MSKMHCFSNKFSKIAKRWGVSVIWPNCGFLSWLWRHWTSVMTSF